MNNHFGKITAVLLAAALSTVVLTGCSSGKKNGTDADSTASSGNGQTTEEADSESETETMTEAVTEHISPQKSITSVLGTQIDTDAVLTREEGSNTYKTKLSGLMQPGDTVSSFTFIFKADSNIGTYKGGWGISVEDGCPAATDDGWYQSENFEQRADGAYIEVTIAVPADVQPYISADGEVLIGYWWGDAASVTLTEIICSYSRTAEVPVDDTRTIEINATLNYESDETNTVKVPLGDVLGEDGIPQAITFDIEAGSSFRKFTGAFGITTDSWYQSETVAVMTEASSLSLTWLVPEEIKGSIPTDAEVMLGYWWGGASDMTLTRITVDYKTENPVPQTTAPVIKPEITGGDVHTAAAADVTTEFAGDAMAIAKDMKIGWNLGNTMDCYNVSWKVNDFETAWGNLHTTKEMITAVKNAGFRTIRVPVAWTDHLSEDGTIDADWMARVHEVVDYAMSQDLYTIIDVHHDDYTWLNPTYADEAAVTAKYIKIWEQICAEFGAYDTRLLFEGMNEPRVIDSPNEWMGGTEEERDVINHMLAKFVETVRATGGNNAKRTLIVPTHAASITEAAVNGLVVPDDGNIIVSIHNYAPWKFTDKQFPNEKTFTDAGKAEIDKGLDFIKSHFMDNGIPVIIGEFGAEYKDNDADREEYYAYYIQSAKQRGITCLVWDNGPQDSYGLLNRKKLNWYNPTIIEKMMAVFSN